MNKNVYNNNMKSQNIFMEANRLQAYNLIITVYGDDVDDPYLYMKETEWAPFTVTETNMSACLGDGIEVIMTFTGPCLQSP